MSGGRLDFSGIIQNVFHLFKGKLNTVCLGPTDGSVLKLHYRLAFYFTLGGFMAVWYGWFFGKVIHCVSDFKGDQEARIDYAHICLSYPYVEDENGKERFLLFYRWVHWYFLVLAFLFYIPRKISKSIENPKAKKILEDLTTLSPRYDQAERDVSQRAMNYMVTNVRTHNSLYFSYLGLNVIALMIDTFILRFTDFIFHDRFISLVPRAYPFNRDPLQFKDYISQTFPPFASCILGDVHKILDGRTEKFGCHLINMELYEKLFIIFWFLIYILIVATLLHIIYLLLMLLPWARKWFIPTSKPLNATISTRKVISNVLGCLKVGDIYMLYRLKQQMSPSRFYELLFRLGDPKLMTNRIAQEIPTLNPKLHYEGVPDEHSLKNKQFNDPNVTMTSPHNPYLPDSTNRDGSNLLNTLLNNPNNREVIKRYPELLKAKGIPNTSILIE